MELISIVVLVDTLFALSGSVCLRKLPAVTTPPPLFNLRNNSPISGMRSSASRPVIPEFSEVKCSEVKCSEMT
jgi:hypothetical protein